MCHFSEPRAALIFALVVLAVNIVALILNFTVLYQGIATWPLASASLVVINGALATTGILQLLRIWNARRRPRNGTV